jgi:hypothetical protein
MMSGARGERKRAGGATGRERTNGGTPEFGVPPFVTNDGTGGGEEEDRRRSWSDGVSG